MEKRADSLSATEQLAEWIYNVKYEDIPERVLEKNRYQTLNVLAAIEAGANTAAGKSVFEALTRRKNIGACTVFPSGEKLTLQDAVTINSAYSMALDYDDYLYMGHTGHSAVLGSWAVCEEENLGTRDFVLAQVVANEIGGRVGASTVLGPQNGQAWSFIHAVEGAALGAKLYGLTQEQTAHALAIALYQPTFTLWPGFMGPQSKVLTAAQPTITGIQAAQMARAGLTGAREIFEHPRKGFWKFFTFVPLPEMLGDLGTAWVSDTLAYKRYPGCAYIDTTMDALFEALAKYKAKTGQPLLPEEVAAVTVEASLLTIEMDNLSAEHIHEQEPLSPVNINFSIPFNIGIGIVAGQHTGAQMDQAFLDNNQQTIRSLAGKTRLIHSWDMTGEVIKAFDGNNNKSIVEQISFRDLGKVIQGYMGELGGAKKNSIQLKALLKNTKSIREIIKFRKAAKQKAHERKNSGKVAGRDFSAFKMAFPARVTLHTQKGETFSAYQKIPYGAPGQEPYLSAVEEKWHTEAGVRLNKTKINAAQKAVLDFENRDLGEITKKILGKS